MAGLLLKELKIRGLMKRTLLITPANLTFRWQREPAVMAEDGPNATHNGLWLLGTADLGRLAAPLRALRYHSRQRHLVIKSARVLHENQSFPDSNAVVSVVGWVVSQTTKCPTH